VGVEVRRDGGSIATAAAELCQGDDARIAALATYGDLCTLGDDVHTTAVEPAMPPPEECVPNTMAPAELREIAALMDRFEMRFNPDHIGWAPTLELTAHVRARPAPGWLKVRHATRSMGGGMFEEDCEVWDSGGRLVAHSRQLAPAASRLRPVRDGCGARRRHACEAGTTKPLTNLGQRP
jgi:hypothetical protein